LAKGRLILKMMSARIYDFLTLNKIEFEIEYSFDDLLNITHLRFDFMIKINSNDFILVEYDGQQHFTVWHDENDLNSLRVRDKMKDKYCAEKGYKLIRIPYWESPIDSLTKVKRL
jgi:very-short-patch-repair endonuclease